MVFTWLLKFKRKECERSLSILSMGSTMKGRALFFNAYGEGKYHYLYLEHVKIFVVLV